MNRRLSRRKKTRDHTEDMIRQFGGEDPGGWKNHPIKGGQEFQGQEVIVLEIFPVQPFG